VRHAPVPCPAGSVLALGGLGDPEGTVGWAKAGKISLGQSGANQKNGRDVFSHQMFYVGT